MPALPYPYKGFVPVAELRPNHITQLCLAAYPTVALCGNQKQRAADPNRSQRAWLTCRGSRCLVGLCIKVQRSTLGARWRSRGFLYRIGRTSISWCGRISGSSSKWSLGSFSPCCWRGGSLGLLQHVVEKVVCRLPCGILPSCSIRCRRGLLGPESSGHKERPEFIEVATVACQAL